MDKEVAITTAITFVAEEHIFTYLLSSPFTARNLVVERDDVEAVKKDLMLSLILSFGLSFIIGSLTKQIEVILFGVAFGFLLYYVYAWRGELL